MTLSHDERSLLLHMLEASTFPGNLVDAVSAARANLREGRFLPDQDRKLLGGFIASAQVPGRLLRPVVAILDKLEASPLDTGVPDLAARGASGEEVMCGLESGA
ncbi:hypothetical protein [Acidomonas methanolica]|uniref:Uncharacterized protein n=1 Tax=Acidomonas methanolica NBRC 104435 TaxID=1231351 RepID=A0A023D6H3_ACIMT|nr:hypothetical protein [Acidomonas methanolica]TCS24101.1 hypothetical protein EDC31_12522 [Acidomonas methanolica]GAJ29747.1 hypothetical protein Amme_076_040 [Acidomonas methanolica NBRC 104435]GBQ59387.1 hypothetical protein AA0498_2742 [Acidomonas methanolica]GEL00016.1 hypothetical protein AME01nite_25140 [Acidomonas methanolica NBRC 104435]